MLEGIITATVIVGVVGLIVGLFLGIAAISFKVEVDEREEATLNVQLNNPSMQGDWDFDKLANMAEEFDLDLSEDMGFTETDIDLMFDGDDRFSQLFENKEVENLRESVQKVKDAKSASIERMKEKDCIDWFVVIMFDTQEKKIDFLKEISIPKYEQYITEEQVRRIAKE